MPRKKHPDKEVEKALQYAESAGWTIIEGGGHARGKLRCPFNSNDCRCGIHCTTSIWSTPQNPGNHARQIRRVVDNCSGGMTETAKEAESATDSSET